jgi:excisionase family DNA binding protein
MVDANEFLRTQAGSERMPDLADYVTTQEAERLSGYKLRWIRQLAQEGKLEAIKVGRTWLVNKDNLQAYVREMRELGTGKHNPSRGKH